MLEPLDVVQDGGGSDPGVEMVREFHEMAGLICPPFRGAPPLGAEASLVLSSAACQLRQLAHRLKTQCRQLRADGHGRQADVLVRIQLHVEENAELAEALLEGDIVRILHELTDVSYSADGTYLTLGLGELKVAADLEVHRANMSKAWPDGRGRVDAAGRVLKGPAFARADVGPVVKGAAGRAKVNGHAVEKRA